MRNNTFFSNETAARLKTIYLLGLSIVIFAVEQPWLLGALFAFQLALWIGTAGTIRPVVRIFRRLTFFFSMICLSYAFLPLSGGGDRWMAIPLGSWSLEINVAGIETALAMCLRVWLLVSASSWVQSTSEPGAFVKALSSLRVPKFLALTLDTTLSQVSGRGEGQGKGSGRGGGKSGGEAASEEPRRTTDLLRRAARAFGQIRRGDWTFFHASIQSALERSEKRIASENPALGSGQARDLAVIAGISTAMMGLKMMRILPGLPLAPGHKNLLMVPMFLMSAHWTGMRFGGLWTGLTVGTVSFMLGFGKYGILEVAQFAVPGLMADILLGPVAGNFGGTRLAGFVFLGAVLGFGRFTANLMTIFLAGAPQAVFVLFLPMLLSQVTFGALSGFVSVAFILPGGRPDTLPQKENPAARETGETPPT